MTIRKIEPSQTRSAEGLVGARILYGGKHARLVGTAPSGRAVRLVVSISPRLPSVQGVKVMADIRRALRS